MALANQIRKFIPRSVGGQITATLTAGFFTGGLLYAVGAMAAPVASATYCNDVVHLVDDFEQKDYYICRDCSTRPLDDKGVPKTCQNSMPSAGVDHTNARGKTYRYSTTTSIGCVSPCNTSAGFP